jgi:riboflavin biosynthesis pyrimidine reductase
MMQACGAVMRHASVTTATTAAVDACILTERASAQAISANRSWLATTGFQMKTCAFTVQSDKVEAALPALQENWAEVKRSILQSETAVISAVALQIQGAQRVMTESVGASLTVTTSQNTHTHVLLHPHTRLSSPRGKTTQSFISTSPRSFPAAGLSLCLL